MHSFLFVQQRFSWISLGLGPALHGYGFFASVALTAAAGFVILLQKLNQLEYETFMLNPVTF